MKKNEEKIKVEKSINKLIKKEIKINNIKILLLILLMIIGFVLVKIIYEKFEENKKIEQNEQIESENSNIQKKELDEFENYLGKYIISYNEEYLKQSELSEYNFVNQISIEKKCYRNINNIVSNGDDIIDYCLNAVDFETIEQVGGVTYGYNIYKINEEESILKIELKNIIDVTKNSNYSQLYLERVVCFKFTGDNALEQTSCVNRKNGYSSIDDYLDIGTSYEFKLVRIS